MGGIILDTVVIVSYGLIGLLGVVSLACGLYWIAEMIERNPLETKRIIKYWLCFVVGIHILLLMFESLPSWLLIEGICAHAVYGLLLKRFPLAELTHPLFISS